VHLRFIGCVTVVFALALASSAGAQDSTRTITVNGQRMTVPARPMTPERQVYTGMAIGGVMAMLSDGKPGWRSYPVVKSVAPGSPAAKAGLVAGDSILTVNGNDARRAAVAAGKPGDTIVLKVRRGTAIRDFRIVTTTKPTPG
jgi:S1-C subfamily serine protease